MEVGSQFGLIFDDREQTNNSIIFYLYLAQFTNSSAFEVFLLL